MGSEEGRSGGMIGNAVVVICEGAQTVVRTTTMLALLWLSTFLTGF